MKETNFNHVSLDIREKPLIDALEAGYEKGVFPSKTSYITSLIKSGLQRQDEKDISKITAEWISNLTERMVDLQTQFTELQIDANTNQKMISAIYRMMESLVKEEYLSAFGLDEGDYDDLPKRFAESARKKKEEIGLA